MVRYAVLLCVLCVCAFRVDGQRTTLEPIVIPAGTIVPFHLQTRLNPEFPNQLDTLTRGTTVPVRILMTVDSRIDPDGAEFRGELAVPIMSGSQALIRSGSEARGILVLLRSGKHPEGFRYELLLTSIRENGKTFELTASLNAVLSDGGSSRETAKAAGALM